LIKKFLESQKLFNEKENEEIRDDKNEFVINKK
jgi:hypothetical protein